MGMTMTLQPALMMHMPPQVKVRHLAARAHSALEPHSYCMALAFMQRSWDYKKRAVA
jgi:hypothetical protein